MPAPSLMERLKRARMVQVLLVYLGASWVVLQIADTLTEALSLPEWVLPVCVLLLLVGLIIILATAWVQSLPSTTAKEEAGELPTDWEIAPKDVVTSLKSGRLPHLTWGRAVLGGVVALSLLFGGTGLYVGFTGGPGRLGPQEAGADEAAAGIAVVPFAITGGEDLDLWREGMVDLTRELMRETGQGSVADVRLGALTTTSLPALRAYLEGEAAFRNADFAAAITSYEQAVELDSLFALAWMRLASAYGWLDNINSEAGGRAGERSGDADFFPTLREAVQLYPDDPDLWNELGEYIYHVGLDVGMAAPEQAFEAFERAIELDPSFGPYHVHPLEFTIAQGDRADAEARLERYQALTDDRRNVEEFSLAIPLLLGDSAEAARAIARSQSMDMGSLSKLRIAFTHRQDNYRRLRQMMWTNRNRAGADHQWILYSLVAEGALARHDRLLDSLDVPTGIKGLSAGWAMGNWSEAAGLPNSSLARPSTCEQPVTNSTCQLFVGWGRARAGDLATARESARILRARARDRESAFLTRSADLVEGTVAAQEGRVGDARRLLAPVARGVDNPASLARTSLGELEHREGNVTEAIRHHTGNLFNYNRFQAILALARLGG